MLAPPPGEILDPPLATLVEYDACIDADTQVNQWRLVMALADNSFWFRFRFIIAFLPL